MWYVQKIQPKANAHFCLYLSMLWQNLIIFDTHKRQFMTNSAMQKVNNNLNEFKQRAPVAGRQVISCCQKSHLHRAFDVASKQCRLEPGRLCSVGSLAAASVLSLWWLFETVEQLKQAIADEWCALYQKFIDRSINEWPLRLKCVVEQWQTY